MVTLSRMNSAFFLALGCGVFQPGVNSQSPGSGTAYGSSDCTPLQLPAVIRAVALPQSAGGTINPGTNGGPPTGFYVSLLDAISLRTGIPYVLTLRPDFLLYNGLVFNGTVIQSLINNKADLAATVSSITLAGVQAVDYLQTIQSDSMHIQLLVNRQFGINNATQYIVAPQYGDLAWFKDSKNPANLAIYQNILAGTPDSFPLDDDEGVARVLSGNYAYIVDSPIRDDLLAQDPVHLAAAPGDFGIRYCALAVRLGSPLRSLLNAVLQEFSEDGTLSLLTAQFPDGQGC